MKPWLKWTLGGIGLLIVIGLLVPAEDEPADAVRTVTVASETPGSGAAEEQQPKRATKPPPPAKSCGKVATDECTPHVGFGGSVRVDALIWKVRSVRTATTLGDQQYGLGAKADGRFVIVTLAVHSDKDESATLSGDSVQLEIGGNTYDTDSDGTVAAVGAGEDPFFLEDIGPDADISGKVVFDVPPRVLSRKVEMRFNELGFGSTHGYIRLPDSSLGS